jgi:hypothetical protein
VKSPLVVNQFLPTAYLASVDYRIGTYSGTIVVAYEPDDDNETLISRAKRELRRKCGGAGIYPGGPCSESWTVRRWNDGGPQS